ncbi:MAG: electron transport protein SCO1/SenC [Bryobacterales bacterium]|nr:electron transport protein SCO1/SenC [Bryobacterales bacterium]
MRTCAAIVLFLLLAACRQATVKEEAKDEPLRHYPLHGEVLRLDAQGKIAAIKHEKIGDWMEAMTMEFPVKDQSEFDKLHPGEKINATVFVQGNSYWVGEIQEDTAPAPASK